LAVLLGSSRILPFIVDAMLGKLARWLRIIGHDTLYDPSLEDETLISIAKHDGRTVVTRDAMAVYTSKAAAAGFIASSVLAKAERGDRLEDYERDVLLFWHDLMVDEALDCTYPDVAGPKTRNNIARRIERVLSTYDK
jgi:hypothetical protein